MNGLKLMLGMGERSLEEAESTYSKELDSICKKVLGISTSASVLDLNTATVVNYSNLANINARTIFKRTTHRLATIIRGWREVCTNHDLISYFNNFTPTVANSQFSNFIDNHNLKQRLFEVGIIPLIQGVIDVFSSFVLLHVLRRIDAIEAELNDAKLGKSKASTPLWARRGTELAELRRVLLVSHIRLRKIRRAALKFLVQCKVSNAIMKAFKDIPISKGTEVANDFLDDIVDILDLPDETLAPTAIIWIDSEIGKDGLIFGDPSEIDDDSLSRDYISEEEYAKFTRVARQSIEFGAVLSQLDNDSAVSGNGIVIIPLASSDELAALFKRTKERKGLLSTTKDPLTAAANRGQLRIAMLSQCKKSSKNNKSLKRHDGRVLVWLMDHDLTSDEKVLFSTIKNEHVQTIRVSTTEMAINALKDEYTKRKNQGDKLDITYNAENFRVITNQSRMKDVGIPSLGIEGGENAGKSLVQWMKSQESVWWRTLPLMVVVNSRSFVEEIQQPQKWIFAAEAIEDIISFATFSQLNEHEEDHFYGEPIEQEVDLSSEAKQVVDITEKFGVGSKVPILVFIGKGRTPGLISSGKSFPTVRCTMDLAMLTSFCSAQLPSWILTTKKNAKTTNVSDDLRWQPFYSKMIPSHIIDVMLPGKINSTTIGAKSAFFTDTSSTIFVVDSKTGKTYDYSIDANIQASKLSVAAYDNATAVVDSSQNSTLFPAVPFLAGKLLPLQHTKEFHSFYKFWKVDKLLLNSHPRYPLVASSWKEKSLKSNGFGVNQAYTLDIESVLASTNTLDWVAKLRYYTNTSHPSIKSSGTGSSEVLAKLKHAVLYQSFFAFVVKEKPNDVHVWDIRKFSLKLSDFIEYDYKCVIDLQSEIFVLKHMNPVHQIFFGPSNIVTVTKERRRNNQPKNMSRKTHVVIWNFFGQQLSSYPVEGGVKYITLNSEMVFVLEKNAQRIVHFSAVNGVLLGEHDVNSEVLGVTDTPDIKIASIHSPSPDILSFISSTNNRIIRKVISPECNN